MVEVCTVFVIASCGKMPKDNRCMYMAHVYFYVCCSDCEGVCGNVCCVAAVVKDSVFCLYCGLCSGFHLHTICVVNTLSHSYRV